MMIHADLASIIRVTAWPRFLVRIRTDPKTVQTLLRHSDVKLTLQCYTHSVSDGMAAAGAMLCNFSATQQTAAD
jgi:integrase